MGPGTFRYVLILILFGLAVAFVVREFFHFYLGISGSRSDYLRDAQSLKALLQEVKLSPLDFKELDLLSYSGEMTRQTDLTSYTETGVIYTVYEEPVMAYAFKTYKANHRKIILVSCNDDLLQYERRGNLIFVFENGREAGTIDVSDRLVYKNGDHRVQLSVTDKAEALPMQIDGKWIFNVRSQQNAVVSTEQMRVLEVLEPYEEDQAKLAFRLLAFAIVDERI